MNKLIQVSVAVLLAAGALPAMAQTWNATSGFTQASFWTHAERKGTGCVTPAVALNFNYAGPSGTNFIGHQGVAGTTIVPLVAKNLATSGPTAYSSAQIPAGAVWMHPGETGVNQTCAAMSFRAPTPGTYRVRGFIKSIDVSANTVNGYIFASDILAQGPIKLTGPMGTSAAFDKMVTVLPGKLTIDFALDDGGSYFNDSTQLDLRISRCSVMHGKAGKDGMDGMDAKDGKGNPHHKPCGEGDDDENHHGNGHH